LDVGTLTGRVEIEDQLSGVLATLAQRTKNFADSFDGSMGLLVKGPLAVVVALTAVGTAIGALGMRGSDINDVSKSLDQLSGSSIKAKEIIETLRSSTLGVIADFDLMKTSTRLLAGGVKLSTDDFKLLGSAASVLADQGLGTTKEMLDKVTSALMTGRTQMLASIGVKLDVKKAEETYAAALKTTREDLTVLEQTEARRAGVLEMLAQKVKSAGVAQKDFADILNGVVVTVKNWFNQLAAGVASSPSVMRALDAIGKAFTDVFGGSTQSALDIVIRGVNKFADAVTAVMPYVTALGKFIVDFTAFLWRHQESLIAAAAAWVAMRTAIGLAEGAMWLGSAAAKALAADLVLVAGAAAAPVLILTGLSAGLATLYQVYKLRSEGQERMRSATANEAFAAQNLATINKNLGTSYADINDAMRATRQRAEEATVAQAAAKAATTAAAEVAEKQARVGQIAEDAAIAAAQKHAEELKALAKFTGDLTIAKKGLLVWQMASVDALIKEGYSAEQAALKLGLNALAVSDYLIVSKTLLDLNKNVNSTWEDLTKSIEVYTDRIAKAMISNHAALQSAQRDLVDFMGSRAGTELDRKLSEIDRRMKDSLARLDHYADPIGSQKAALGIVTLAANQKTGAIYDDQKDMDAKSDAFIAAMRADGDAARRFGEEANLAAFDGLANLFTAMGQISGDGLGSKFLTSIGNMVVGLRFARQETQKMSMVTNAAGESVHKDAKFGSLSVMFDKGASGANRFAAGVASAAGIAQGAISIWNATGQSASKAQNAMSGALAGAQAGAMFGPWGVAVGAAAGLVTGVLRGKPAWAQAASEVGRDFGVKISDELAKSIAAQAKKDFGGSRQASSLFNLDKIIAEGGGVNQQNVGSYTAKMRDVFVMLEMGAFSSAQALEVLDKNFAALVEGNTDELGFWSDSLKEIIELNSIMGVGSKAIQDAMKGQSNIIMDSFNTIVAGTVSARKGYADIKKNIDDATSEVKKLNEVEAKGRGVEWTRDMEAAQKKLTAALAAQHAAGTGATRELKDLGQAAAESFAIALATGSTFNQALKAALPGLSGLHKAYTDLGMNIEDPFVRMLVVLGNVADKNPELMASVDALGSRISALANLNMLNADSFALTGRLASDAYERLKEKVLEAGGSATDALIPMQDYLQRAVEASTRLGIPLDANTQALLDQSIAAGIWKEKGPSAQELMQTATENLTEAINKLIIAFRGLPNSLPNPFRDWTTPTGPGPSGNREQGYDRGGIVGRDGRTPSSRDVIPAWLRRGEIVITPEQLSMPSVAAPDFSRSEQPQIVQLIVDGKKMTDVVINRMGNRLALGGVR